MWPPPASASSRSGASLPGGAPSQPAIASAVPSRPSSRGRDSAATGEFLADESVRSKASSPLTPERIEAIVARLVEGRGVRRSLPGWGRVHIERPLPFLCVYRRPVERADQGTDRLVLGQASHIRAPSTKELRAPLAKLVERLAEAMVERFGAFLVLELWSQAEPVEPSATAPPRPAFQVYRPEFDDTASAAAVLEDRLGRVKTSAQAADVALSVVRRIAPPDLPPLLSLRRQRELGCRVLGLAVEPSYVNPETGEPYPLLLRSLRRQIGPALGRAFHRFSQDCTSHASTHYLTLGRRAMVKSVWDVDRKLATISQSFDFLYQVTPVNAQPAWQRFRRLRFDKAPAFQYRPLPIDPSETKRALYSVPIDRIEDPTLMHLFLAKQRELDRQLSMLLDLGTRNFQYGSMQLHGVVEPALLEQAREVLDHTPTRTRENSKGQVLDATEFAAVAQREVDWYRERYPEFAAEVIVTDRLFSGLMVSRSRLLVGHDTRVPAQRANALIQHEVGTHLLTYFNGRAQPLALLHTGLPGYDALQEGLAVLSEHLVGGLSVSRLRVLAARVVAAHALIDGASFVDVFRLLDRNYDFAQRTAWTITMRIFRGGGMLKDAVYLRGLVGLLRLLAEGRKLESLFVGKIATDSLPLVEELRLRRILRPPPITPRYHGLAESQDRLRALQTPTSVLELLPPKKRGSR